MSLRSVSKEAKALLVDAIISECIDFIRDNLEPEEVFSDDELADWALSNGFVREE